jgi:hypothetical protein
VNDLLQYLAANDEYIGWAVWAAGPCKLIPTSQFYVAAHPYALQSGAPTRPAVAQTRAASSQARLTTSEGPSKRLLSLLFVNALTRNIFSSAFETVWPNSIRPNIPLDSENPILHLFKAIFLTMCCLSFIARSAEEERCLEHLISVFVTELPHYEHRSLSLLYENSIDCFPTF